jgi:hypothetical protein
MDYGFTLVPVTMLFLNHSGPVTIRFTLLDTSTVTIAIPIMAFANRYASAYGANSNSNIAPTFLMIALRVFLFGE